MTRILALILAVALPALAQESTPIEITMPQPANDYQAVVNAVQATNGAWAAAAAMKAQALPAAILACSKMAGELAQGLCVLSVTGNIGGGGQTQLMPNATFPVPKETKTPPTLWESVLGAPAATLNAISQFAPSIVQYLISKVQAGSNERIAIAQTTERAGLYQVFGQINQAGMSAIASTAQQGFITIGQIPQGTNTNYNVSGSSGIGFGAGAVTYNPVTSSYNPITRTCSSGAGGAGGAGTTAGSGSPSYGGTC